MLLHIDRFQSLVQYARDPELILYLCVVAVTGLLSYVFYRLVLDPLAKFPGPRLAALTRWYEAYYDVIKGGKYTLKIAELHKQYGPIIRISPWELHVSDPAFYEVLYRQSDRWERYPFTVVAFDATDSVGVSINHDVHRVRRAALNSFFSKASMAARQERVVHYVEQLSDKIDDYVWSGEILGLGSYFGAMTCDIATDIFLGDARGAIGRQRIEDGMWNNSFSNGVIWHAYKHVPFFKLIIVVKFLIERSLGLEAAPVTDLVNFHQVVNCKIGEIMIESKKGARDENASHTLVDHIMKAPNLPPEDKEMKRVNQEVNVILSAGMETVATTLRVIVFWVYSTPDVLNRLRAELSEQVNPSEISNFAKLEQLPYLTAVILEGLRLNPGIVSRSPRVAPDRPLIYKDWVIPAGTPVGMTAWLMHHDEDLYPQPRVFDPDRWTDPEKRRAMEKTFGPFGRGTRNCIGMHLAWMEMYLTLAMLVSRYDLEFAGTQASDVECGSDMFLMAPKTKNGVKAFVRRFKS